MTVILNETMIIAMYYSWVYKKKTARTDANIQATHNILSLSRMRTGCRFVYFITDDDRNGDGISKTGVTTNKSNFATQKKKTLITNVKIPRNGICWVVFFFISTHVAIFPKETDISSGITIFWVYSDFLFRCVGTWESINFEMASKENILFADKKKFNSSNEKCFILHSIRMVNWI